VARRGHRWSQTGTVVSDGHPDVVLERPVDVIDTAVEDTIRNVSPYKKMVESYIRPNEEEEDIDDDGNDVFMAENVQHESENNSVCSI